MLWNQVLFIVLLSANVVTAKEVCTGEELSFESRPQKQKFPRGCIKVLGDIRIANLTGLADLSYLKTVRELYGSLEVAHTKGLDDSLNMQNLALINASGSKPAISITGNSNLRISLGDSLRIVAAPKAPVTYKFLGNDPASLPTDIYTKLYQAAYPFAVFQMDTPLDTNVCHANFYKMLAAVVGTLSLAVSAAMVVFACYGRDHLDVSDR